MSDGKIDTLKTTTPLLNKVLLNWLAQSYVWVRATEEQRAAIGLKQPRGIGYGIGLAVALFAMQGTLSCFLCVILADILIRNFEFGESFFRALHVETELLSCS